jgi:hypothetical protein
MMKSGSFSASTLLAHAEKLRKWLGNLELLVGGGTSDF